MLIKSHAPIRLKFSAGDVIHQRPREQKKTSAQTTIYKSCFYDLRTMHEHHHKNIKLIIHMFCCACANSTVRLAECMQLKKIRNQMSMRKTSLNCQ
jgi:hypothetical protein